MKRCWCCIRIWSKVLSRWKLKWGQLVQLIISRWSRGGASNREIDLDN
ncbi:hypothetical protein RchiOBHm_Chr1g0356091 [Rosa chinensis]|uniref:Uncharacterized protein n=1 Tax=Rosa chinensis TaxID=74649 RepID=A0A2P6SHL2_ROSCH|nr:hypothetical protein RchiOBHm_Chr1g0356091 [Rosa chinensis]